jgi:hypothetical protein
MVFRIYPMVTFGQPFVIIFDCALTKYPHINSLPFAYIVAVLPYPVDGTFGVFPSMYIFCLLYLFPSNVLWPCISYVCLSLTVFRISLFHGRIGFGSGWMFAVLFGWARVLHCVYMIGGLLYMFSCLFGVCVFLFINCGNRLSRCGVSRLLLFYIYTYILSSLSFLLDENHRKISIALDKGGIGGVWDSHFCGSFWRGGVDGGLLAVWNIFLLLFASLDILRIC